MNGGTVVGSGDRVQGGRHLGTRLAPMLVWLAVVLASPVALRSADGSEAFDAARALANATHLAGTIGERAAGTPGEAAAGMWLADQFSALGYDVVRQPFRVVRFAVPYTATNIIAEKPGLPGYGILFVGAHYDTRFPIDNSPLHGPGANDNASGTGVLLEAARVVAGESFSPTVRFIAFSAEEDGLVGSYYHVAHLSLAERLRAEGMLNLDCVGIGSSFQVLVRDEAHLPFAQGLGIVADKTAVESGAMSDHVPFAAAGIPAAFLFMEPELPPCGPDYHQVTDTPDKLEVAALARTGNALVGALRTVAAQAQPREVHFQFLPEVARN